MLKLIISFALLAAVLTKTTEAIDRSDCFKTVNETPCQNLGGMCVAESDCPPGKLEPVRGLCPKQQKQGVECCYGIPKSEKRCRCNGGECVPRSDRCPENLTYKDANDCKANEKCCIRVTL